VNLREFVRGLPVRTYHALPNLIKLLLRGNSRGFVRELRALAPRSRRGYKPAAFTPVTSLYHRCESELEYEDLCGRIRCATGRPIYENEVISLRLIGDILRTLLHRNDCLGMAASIESRFPFLDSRLVKLAVNMPYRYKVRFSPATLDGGHPFLRDKWVLRKVAERYLPAVLSRRRKRGFPINAHARMQIPAEFFKNSFLADLFDLDRQATRYLINHASRELKRRLLHLEVWAHVCLHNAPRHKIVEKLKNHIIVQPFSRR
jgi:asparagine synthase (glutamine-hydrolysing)